MRRTPNPDMSQVAQGPAGAEHAWVPDELSALAAEIKALVCASQMAEARDRFGGLVLREQRRASRIAYHFLRDGAEADEAVQDAFLKVFTHIASFREDLPFGVWFTRILINGCLDRQKARRRRTRWFRSASDAAGSDRDSIESRPTGAPSPEEMLLRRERRRRLAGAIGTLRGRQRSVFLLCHFDDRSPREIGAIMGLNDSTVRVHLFRAVRKLRTVLEGKG